MATGASAVPTSGSGNGGMASGVQTPSNADGLRGRKQATVEEIDDDDV